MVEKESGGHDRDGTAVDPFPGNGRRREEDDPECRYGTM